VKAANEKRKEMKQTIQSKIKPIAVTERTVCNMATSE
jgi:hypothetical protein